MRLRSFAWVKCLYEGRRSVAGSVNSLQPGGSLAALRPIPSLARNTATGRQQTAGSRQQAGDSRQQTEGSRQQTAAKINPHPAANSKSDSRKESEKKLRSGVYKK